MLIKLLVYWTIVNISIWICYCSVSHELQVIPFPLNGSSTIISEFSITWKFLAKKRTFISAVCKFVLHFSFNLQVVLVGSFEFASILVLNNEHTIHLVISPLAFYDSGTLNRLFNQTIELFLPRIGFLSFQIFCFHWSPWVLISCEWSYI